MNEAASRQGVPRPGFLEMQREIQGGYGGRPFREYRVGQKACRENRGKAQETLAGTVVVLEHYMPKP